MTPAVKDLIRTLRQDNPDASEEELCEKLFAALEAKPLLAHQAMRGLMEEMGFRKSSQVRNERQRSDHQPDLD